PIFLIVHTAIEVEGLHGDSKVRGVNLGGWLVVEGWIKPSLFDGIPNEDMLDGTGVQFKSVALQKYVSSENGGDMNVTVDRDVPSSWETFRVRCQTNRFVFCLVLLWGFNMIIIEPELAWILLVCTVIADAKRLKLAILTSQYLLVNPIQLPSAFYLFVMYYIDTVDHLSSSLTSAILFLQLWRVSDSEFQFRTSRGQFMACEGDGGFVSATSKSPSTMGTFFIDRNHENRVHLRVRNGTYLQASMSNQLTADYPGIPGWDDNAATFEMTIVANNLHGDYQLANGYGHDKAKEVLNRHRNNFITEEDYKFLHRHGINTVRIPVGWWIAFDPNPPAPFIGGTLEALDNAFSWAQAYSIECIIDLHAAPGSQNGMEHSASRDGTTGWPTSPDYISQTLDVIEFLASRYAKHPAILGFELLNEPSAPEVPLDVLVLFYKQGYQMIRKYSSAAYVIICQRIGNVDPFELYQADIGSFNIVVDLHYYNLFDATFVNMSVEANIQYIFKGRETQLKALNNANGPLVFIGEWVNEWDVTSASQTDYQDFGRAQLDVYNAASFGWAYWTLKNDRMHWDFEWNIRNSYLQLGYSPNMQLRKSVLLLGLACVYFLLHP
ncbi:hypothetical protein RJ639_001018, partial [Escallonia herrerae]